MEDKVDNAIEELSQLIDSADSYLAASTLALPASLHVEGLKGGIKEMRAKLFEIYTALGGEDVWTD